jgi:glutamate carboxypeptidase
MSRGWLSQFQARAPALLGDLEALVRLESPSDDADRVSGAAAWIRDRLREAGVPAELRPCPPRGAALLASLGPPEGGTLLLGHLDTVWPVGTLGERPWRLEGGRAHGPGVFDMKAGIAVGMAVLAAVARESPAPRVSMLLVPDEEVGSAASRELTVSVARRNRRVLVLEPSQDGAAKVARKGCGTFRVTFSGRAAHAGLEPERGASALAEMASALRGYRPADQGVTVVVEGGFDRPPLEPSAASTALYETARRLAADLGFDLGAARVGGGSDGNFTAAAGIPTLDGLGPRGDGAHARDEHVLVGDLSVRAALLTALVCEA